MRYSLAFLAVALIAPTVGAQNQYFQRAEEERAKFQERIRTPQPNLYFQRAEEERAKFQERIRALSARPDAGGPWGLLSLFGPGNAEKAAAPPPIMSVPPAPGGVWVQGPYGPVLVRPGILGRPWMLQPYPPGP